MSKPESNINDRTQNNEIAESKESNVLSQDALESDDAQKTVEGEENNASSQGIVESDDSQKTEEDKYQPPSQLKRTYAVGPGHITPQATPLQRSNTQQL